MIWLTVVFATIFVVAAAVIFGVLVWIESYIGDRSEP